MKYKTRYGHQFRSLRAGEIREQTGKPHIYRYQGVYVVSGPDEIHDRELWAKAYAFTKQQRKQEK